MKHPAKAKKAGANREVIEFLAAFTPEVRKLALATRVYVRRIIPKAIEMGRWEGADHRARLGP